MAVNGLIFIYTVAWPIITDATLIHHSSTRSLVVFPETEYTEPNITNFVWY